MTDREFFRLFRKHAKIIRKKRSYRIMLKNFITPRMGGELCPFGGPNEGDYLVISESGKIVSYDIDLRDIDPEFYRAMFNWRYDPRRGTRYGIGTSRDHLTEGIVRILKDLISKEDANKHG